MTEQTGKSNVCRRIEASDRAIYNALGWLALVATAEQLDVAADRIAAAQLPVETDAESIAVLREYAAERRADG